MSNWGNIYRDRAKRARSVSQRQLAEEAKIVRAGVREAVQIELYDRTNLPVTKGLLRSVVLQFAGNRYVVGFDKSIAPYAKIRASRTGTSKAGGHRLDMNPGAYVRANIAPRLRALRAHRMREILGKGENQRTN